jgi:nitrous oxidase accessory protein
MVMAALMLVAAAYSGRWSPILLIPAMLFPCLYLADLYFWLRGYGLHLDPHAPMNRSIKPFVPTLLGTGKVGQFKTEASLGVGMYLALTASGLAAFFAAVRWFKWNRKPDVIVEGKPLPDKTLATAVAVFALFLPHGLSAATWDVRTNGPLSKIADAVAQAAEGDTIEVHGGTHWGPITIDKKVHLVGRDWPLIDGQGRGTVVTLAAAGTRMEGFRVRASGDKLANEDGDGGILVTAQEVVVKNNRLDDVLFGVSLRNAHNSRVHGNVLRGKMLDKARRGDLIRLWWSHDAVVDGNDVADGRDLVLWYSKRLTVRNNTVREGRYGIHFMYCDDATVAHNRFHDNAVGSFLMYSRNVRLERNWIENNRGASGYGVGLKDMDSYLLAENVIVNNRSGVFMEGASGELKDNLIGYNERGVTIFTSCRDNAFHDNSFRENGEQVVVEGNSPLSEGNRWRANFWSDYRGLDANGDGRGDHPYRPLQLFERLADRNSGMKLFAHGAAAEAIDYSARLFPVFEPRTKFADPEPRMAAVPSPLVRPLAANWLLLPLGGMLLLGAVACLVNWPLATVCVATDGPALPAARRPEPLAIEVRDLSKRFGSVEVLRGVSFHVRTGEAVALWGANGAGKTTLLRCLLGLLPCEGHAVVLGERCGLGGKECRRLLGYVPQEVKIRADHTVIDCVRFYAGLRGVRLERGERLLRDWDLADVHRRAVSHLSGGMLQKLALVLALLSDPPVLLLDEPTSNLDAAAREEFGRLLAGLKAAGKTLLFCTHRAGEIFSLADRVLVLEQGRVAMQGTPSQLGNRLLKPAVLRLTVPREKHAVAVEMLRSDGFDVRTDGGEIWLDVPAGRKSDAILRLEQCDIKVIDFEVESDRGFLGARR